jgi:hypothetical protein
VGLVARAPNHLGDGVMAMPAVEALVGAGLVAIRAPRWGRDLYRHLGVPVLDRGPIEAVEGVALFAPSLRAAWEGRRARRLVGTPTDSRGWLLSEAIAPREHFGETCAAVAEAFGVVVDPTPRWPRWPTDPEVDVPWGHLAIQATSAMPLTKHWRGFSALAARVGVPVVFYGGPGEDEQVRGLAGGSRREVGLTLPALASALSRARVLLSLDTGPAHFARALGVPTLVLYGSTSPRRSGPSGSVALVGPVPPCGPCHRPRCVHGDTACVDISVERVLDALEGMSPGINP